MSENVMGENDMGENDMPAACMMMVVEQWELSWVGDGRRWLGMRFGVVSANGELYDGQEMCPKIDCIRTQSGVFRGSSTVQSTVRD
jgi:hypothetical protein